MVIASRSILICILLLLVFADHLTDVFGQETKPAFPSYATILKDENIKGVKRTVEVELSKKISKAELEELAAILKAFSLESFPRTFISYRLSWKSGMGMAWATTHYNPNLEVRILGLPLETEKEIRSRPDDPNWKVVGKWIWDTALGRMLVIYEKGGKLYLAQVVDDGIVDGGELTEKTQGGQRAFFKVGSRANDHWVINKKGNLEIRDKDGIFDIAVSVESINQAEEEEARRAEALAQEMELAKQKEKEEEKRKLIERATKLRTWRDSTGKFRVEAKFVRQTDKSVFLEKDGGVVVEVPIEKLSNGDKKLLAELKKVLE